MELQTIEFNKEQEELIKAQIGKTLNNDELLVFMHVAKRAGLDPLAKQIYAIKRGGHMTIQTAIDGFRAIADRTGRHVSTSDAIFEEQNDQVIKATITVQKLASNGIVGDFTASAYFQEYKATGPMWQKMPRAMLAKCAEALALRKAFSAQLTGLYTNDEMKQADNEEDQKDNKLASPSIKEINPENSLQEKMEAKLEVNIGDIIDEINASIFVDIAEEHLPNVPSFLSILADPNRTVAQMNELHAFGRMYPDNENYAQNFAVAHKEIWQLSKSDEDTVRTHLGFIKTLFDTIPFENESAQFEQEMNA